MSQKKPKPNKAAKALSNLRMQKTSKRARRQWAKAAAQARWSR